MKIKHEWSKESEDSPFKILRSRLIIGCDSTESTGPYPELKQRYLEEKHERQIIQRIYGPIESAIYNLRSLFTSTTDPQLVYDEMRRIIRMCQDPTWLE